jgi:type IV pilus assembly protein PilA
MLKMSLNKFNYRQKGFTLIELLVVIIVLGVLAAIAIPSIAKFIGYGRSDLGTTELKEMQTCVTALMADDPKTGSFSSVLEFGNVSQVLDSTARTDLTVDGKSLTSYIAGGIINCMGHYSVDQNGTVTQSWYPD